MIADDAPRRGGCLCGAVTYRIDGAARHVLVCHCTQCRKSSGHYVAASQAEVADIEISGGENLTWFPSSDRAKRAFCSTCGSPLFWRENQSARMSIMAGSIDGSSGLHSYAQLYPEDQGDYYALPDVPVIEQNLSPTKDD